MRDLSDYAKHRLRKIKAEQPKEPTNTKKCNKCKQEWHVFEFQRGSLVCRTCQNLKAKSRRPKVIKVRSHTEKEADTFTELLSMKW